MIEIKGLTKNFHSDHAALLDISHKMDCRPFVVIGEDGAGKTTLLNIIAGLDKNYDGDVFVRDKNRKDLSLEEAEISYITREPVAFFWRSVYYNLLYVFKVKNKKFDKKIADAEIKRVAQDLEIFGLLTKRFSSLCLMDQKLVILARAVLKKSKIVVLDEPFFNLLNFEKASLWQRVLWVTGKLSSGLVVAEKPQNLAYFEGCDIIKLSFGTKIQ